MFMVVRVRLLLVLSFSCLTMSLLEIASNTVTADRSLAVGLMISELTVGVVCMVSSGANFLLSIFASCTKLPHFSQFLVYPASLVFIGYV